MSSTEKDRTSSRVIQGVYKYKLGLFLKMPKTYPNPLPLVSYKYLIQTTSLEKLGRALFKELLMCVVIDLSLSQDTRDLFIVLKECRIC